MSEEKMKAILDAMQGITYLEWKKLSHAIEVKFSSEASKLANQTKMPTSEEIVRASKYLL